MEEANKFAKQPLRNFGGGPLYPVTLYATFALLSSFHLMRALKGRRPLLGKYDKYCCMHLYSLQRDQAQTLILVH